MTVSASPRLGITRWSAESDPFNRTQQDGDHAALDLLTAIDVQDLLANRPAPGIRGRFFTESAASAGLPGTTWREDGTSWRSVGSRIVAASATDVGLIVQGAAAQSANLQGWRNSAGSVLGYVQADASTYLPTLGLGVAGPAASGGVPLTIAPSAAGVVGAIIKGAPSQSSDLAQWQDSTTAVLTRIGPQGSLSVTPSSGTTATQALLAQAGTATQKGAVVKAAASQSANLTEWQDSTGAILSKIGPDGTHSVGTQYLSANASTNPSNFLKPSAAGNIGLRIQAQPSQTNDIFQVVDSSAARLFSINQVGSGALVGTFTVGSGSVQGTYQTIIQSGAAGTTGLGVRGASGQTGNLLQCENNSGVNQAVIGSDGHFTNNSSVNFNNGYLGAGGAYPARLYTPGTGSWTFILQQIQSQTSAILGIWNYQTGTLAWIDNDGSFHSPAFTVVSDAAAKENVRDLPHDPLAVVRKLRPRHFDFIDGEKGRVGLIAQEVEPHLPHAVHKREFPVAEHSAETHVIHGLHLDTLVTYAIGALGQVADRLDAIEARLAAA